MDFEGLINSYRKRREVHSKCVQTVLLQVAFTVGMLTEFSWASFSLILPFLYLAMSFSDRLVYERQNVTPDFKTPSLHCFNVLSSLKDSSVFSIQSPGSLSRRWIPVACTAMSVVRTRFAFVNSLSISWMVAVSRVKDFFSFKNARKKWNHNHTIQNPALANNLHFFNAAWSGLTCIHHPENSVPHHLSLCVCVCICVCFYVQDRRELEKIPIMNKRGKFSLWLMLCMPWLMPSIIWTRIFVLIMLESVRRWNKQEARNCWSIYAMLTLTVSSKQCVSKALQRTYDF